MKNPRMSRLFGAFDSALLSMIAGRSFVSREKDVLNQVAERGSSGESRRTGAIFYLSSVGGNCAEKKEERHHQCQRENYIATR